MNDLDSTADRFAVGELYPEDLPMAAAEALAQGHDTPALVEPACLHRTETRDAPALFRTAPAELGLVANTEAAWSAHDVDVRMRRTENPQCSTISATALGAASHSLTLLRTSVLRRQSQYATTPSASIPAARHNATARGRC